MAFRHGQAALGNNNVCTLWLQGSYFRSACSFKHRHITVNGDTFVYFSHSCDNVECLAVEE